MSDCLFCKIIRKEIPADILFQDEHITVFKDINPAAPVHYLLVPNLHIASVAGVEPGHAGMLGRLFTGARLAAEKLDVHQSGYRLIVNTGPDANQVIFHIHMHLLAGGAMQHPMG